MGIIIRDGQQADIENCLQLDHRYTTDYVWQMTIREESIQREILFKTERLPRQMNVISAVSESRLWAALTPDRCFIVAASRERNEIFGYLTMTSNHMNNLAVIQDLLVTQPYRRQKIGSRLLGAARQWAKEHNLVRLQIETRTKNMPSIQFCLDMGFTFCGFNDQYFPDQDIAIFFSQTLR